MALFHGHNLYLSSIELFKYLSSTNSSRNFIEGEEIINSGLLVLCGFTNVTQTICEIFALCLQTSSLMGEPHEITGQFSINEIISVNNFECTCKAGKGGKCKHIAAVLIYFTRCYNNFNFCMNLMKKMSAFLILFLLFCFTIFVFLLAVLFFCRKQIRDIEIISQTDIKCQWKRQKTDTLSSFKPVPWLQTECWQNKNKNEVVQLTEGQRESVLHKLIKENPDSALAKHKSRKREHIRNIKPKLCLNFVLNEENIVLKQLSSFPLNGQPCCLQTYFNLFGSVDVEEILTSTLENETKWHKERQFLVTGSRCYELFTYSRGDWEMKAKKYFWPKRFSNRAMEYGKKTEKEAREIYETNLNYKVIETGLIISKSNPWLGYSSDGIILGDNNKPVKLLEIKCPVSGQNKSILEAYKDGALEYLKIINFRLCLNPNHQVQMGMCILNVRTCDFIIYSSKTKTFLNILVPFDEDFIMNLLTRVKDNYFSHMLHEICAHST